MNIVQVLFSDKICRLNYLHDIYEFMMKQVTQPRLAFCMYLVSCH